MTIAVPALPTPVPQSTDPINFDARADAFLAALPAFGTALSSQNEENNALNLAMGVKLAEATAQAVASGASAAASAISATAAASSANFKGNWSSLTGALNVPATVLHSGQLWLLTSNLANVTTATPGVSASWLPVVNLDVASRAPIAPTLDLNFAKGYGDVYNPVTGRMERLATWSDLITYTGANRTYTDAKGILAVQGSNVPRITFDPVTGAGRGLSVWGGVSNLFLNSLLDGTPLATQSVTLSAGSYRLSFYGTGTVTLTGAATGALVGSGVYPTRSGLTFTATAGSVTFTVTGSVQFAMLTSGTSDSPFIPTAASAVTAPADVPTITGSNFTKWFNQSEGTFVVVCNPTTAVATAHLISANDGTANNRTTLTRGSSLSSAVLQNTAGAGLLTSPGTSGGSFPGGTQQAVAMSYSGTTRSLSLSGAAAITASGYEPPVVTRLEIGLQLTDGYLNGTIARILYFPRALPSNLQALSAA